jgi:hypothetical protein
MTESTLDRLDRDPGGARRYVASLLAMGATRGQVVEKLRDKYGVTVTTRSVTKWKNSDSELMKLVDELVAIKRELDPDDSRNPLDHLPEPVDQAAAVEDLFGLLDDHPAFADLSARCNLDPDFPDDAAREVLLEDHADDEAFEAACRERLGDWSVHVALGADPADVERVERAMAERTATAA